MDLTSANAVIFPHVSSIDITSGDYAISFWMQALIRPDPGSNIIPWQKTSAGGVNPDSNYVLFVSSTLSNIDGCEYSVTVTGPASVNDNPDPSSVDFTQWTNVVVRKNASGIST